MSAQLRAPDVSIESATSRQLRSRQRYLFWRALVLITLLDIATKEWARHELLIEHRSRAVLGDIVRFTLVDTPGAAFGLHVGAHSRWVFMALTLVAMVVLWQLYVTTRVDDGRRVLALGLVMGGALGNLTNRVTSSRGVVDSLDVGLEQYRWPTFNIADIAITTGALALARVLWKEDTPEQTRNPTTEQPSP